MFLDVGQMYIFLNILEPSFKLNKYLLCLLVMIFRLKLGYRCCDPATKKILISSNVIFVENASDSFQFPIPSSTFCNNLLPVLGSIEAPSKRERDIRLPQGLDNPSTPDRPQTPETIFVDELSHDVPQPSSLSLSPAPTRRTTRTSTRST